MDEEVLIISLVAMTTRVLNSSKSIFHSGWLPTRKKGLKAIANFFLAEAYDPQLTKMLSSGKQLAHNREIACVIIKLLVHKNPYDTASLKSFSDPPLLHEYF